MFQNIGAFFMPYSLKKYLFRNHDFSGKQLAESIGSKLLFVNDSEADINQMIDEFDTIVYNREIIKQGKTRIYMAYYKPRGIESTLNKNIPDNLTAAINIGERLFPLGRLDKESEGLMLLTNDGQIYNHVTHSTSEKEKEYLVKVNKPLNIDVIQKLASGIEIMGKMTKPCLVNEIDETQFSIVLTQGLNRQIRRMCYKIGYDVLSLIRIRICNVILDNLKPGEHRQLRKDEILSLQSI